ncbi:PRC-barrel domain-containing protein [Aliiglaciecola sp. CAU 1673]|uniref:PRC-barrel domain-containing protein n=1 Tax=Aliiglaciecola sp. CAU 1673 TaxID=3032595 RepID=UPI0023DA0FB0|nr:PRC-barrel domain-containing protein [Aliiglaciecola sp. CAU 1673]MDF2180278.1 PRC-barrel domain-containing protein [Aliiglaciecola sp. CAU 1673]
MNVLAHDVKRANTIHKEDEAKPEQILISSLRHHDIYNFSDQKLGHLHDLVQTMPAGILTFAVMTRGGFWGIGENFYAIPWQAFTVDSANNRLRVNMSLDRLKNAPSFDDGNRPDWDDPVWASDIHGYYGAGHAMPKKTPASSGETPPLV